MISIISGALAPGIALLSFIYLKDKYEREPMNLIIKLFLLGAALVFPAYVLERVFQEGILNFDIITSVVNIAIIEEFLKWFTLYFIMYKHTEFNEPYDGIVYAVSISIGFATLENLGYLFLFGTISIIGKVSILSSDSKTATVTSVPPINSSISKSS